MRHKSLEHGETVAATLRSQSFQLISAFNHKTPLAESLGYLTAILYMAPAQVAGGKTLCPFSTAACREGCLYTAGRGQMPRVQNARIRRAQMYLYERERFFDELVGELAQVQAAADANNMTMAVRLNGTSDIKFEDELLDGRTLFDIFDRARFYDFTRIPMHHRRVPIGWHLTWSGSDEPVDKIALHLMAGHNVSAVVPVHEKESAPEWFALGNTEVHVIDGDEHDARFLAPSPSLVLLKPKGRLLKPGNPMVRSGLIQDLVRAGRAVA